MKTLLTVFGYTLREHARRRVFIVSTVVMLILAVAASSLPGIISGLNERKPGAKEAVGVTGETAKTKTVWVLDEGKLLPGVAEKLEKVFSDTSFKTLEAATLEDKMKVVRDDSQQAIVKVEEKNNALFVEVWSRRSGDGITASSLIPVLKNDYDHRILAAAGVPEVSTGKVLSPAASETHELGKSMARSWIAMIALSMLLFFSIYFFGYSVAMSVASEKTSRVMEVLLTSAKPSAIVLGKSLAMGILGLFQMGVVIGASALSIRLTYPEHFSVGGLSLDFSAMTPGFLAFFLLYFVAGYALYAMMNALCGATVSKAEDMNSALIPVNMVCMFAFYFGYFTMMAPDGTAAAVASMIPFSAPFSMPMRLFSTDVPGWQLAVSVAGLVATTVVIAWLTIRLYASAALQFAKRIRLQELLKMSGNT